MQNAFIKYIEKLGQIRHFLVALPAALPLTFFFYSTSSPSRVFCVGPKRIMVHVPVFSTKNICCFFFSSLFIHVHSTPPLSTWTPCANDRLISPLLALSPCVSVYALYLCIYGRVISANYLKQFLCIFYFWNCALLFSLYATSLSVVFHNGNVIVVAKWIYLILVIFFSDWNLHKNRHTFYVTEQKLAERREKISVTHQTK